MKWGSDPWGSSPWGGVGLPTGGGGYGSDYGFDYGWEGGTAPAALSSAPVVSYGALTATERLSYLAALEASHRVYTTVNVYDENELLIGELEGNVITGQVDADATADITKTLSLELEDPNIKFTFDPMGPVSAERFVGVRYHVWVNDIATWASVPVFYGPVSRFERNAHSVTLEAVGKEALMLPPVPPNVPDVSARNEVQRITLSDFSGTDSFKLRYFGATSSAITRGTNYTQAALEAAIENIIPEGTAGSVCTVSAISDTGFTVTFNGIFSYTDMRKLLVVDTSGCDGVSEEKTKGSPSSGSRIVDFIRSAARAHGETKFQLGDGGGRRLPKTYQVHAGDAGAWRVLQQVASDHNRQLYYDADGYLRLRTWPQNSARHTFVNLLDEPAVSYDLSDLRNTVLVTATHENGAGYNVVKLSLPGSHPFSPARLARNDVPRVLLETVEIDKPNVTKAAGTAIARRVLAQKSQGVLSVEFDCLPIPHLELGDVIQVSSETVNTSFPLKKFSLPLTATGAMSIGRVRPVSLKKLRRMVA